MLNYTGIKIINKSKSRISSQMSAMSMLTVNIKTSVKG